MEFFLVSTRSLVPEKFNCFFFKVLLKTVKLSIVCLVMRIKFKIDPSSRKRDLAEVTESYNLPIEGFKYLKWRNEYTVSNFFYTWHMIKDYYKTNLQV